MHYKGMIKYLLNFFKRGKDNIGIIKESRKKLSILHLIETNVSKYYVYSVEPVYGRGNVSVEIWKDDKDQILEDEIFEESWGTLCGDSFDTFVKNCIDVLRDHLKSKEYIIKDNKC